MKHQNIYREFYYEGYVKYSIKKKKKYHVKVSCRQNSDIR